MNPTHAILLPPTLLAFLTFFVWLKLGADRVGELRERRIHPQAIASARDAATKLEKVQSADHFRNLFEVPVLFYVLCGYVVITNLTSVLLLACAWGFVLLRALHTYIHLTHNKVVKRFRAYVASTAILVVMWIVFLVRLLQS